MKYFLYLFIFLGFAANTNSINAQSYSVESKSCGSCGKPVASTSTIGMRCPHCGVRWGYENENTTTKYTPSYRSTTPRVSNSYKAATYKPKYSNSYASSFVSTSTKANLRSLPSTKSRVITTIPAYSPLTVLSRSNGWYRVEYMQIDMESMTTQKLIGYIHTSVVN